MNLRVHKDRRTRGFRKPLWLIQLCSLAVLGLDSLGYLIAWRPRRTSLNSLVLEDPPAAVTLESFADVEPTQWLKGEIQMVEEDGVSIAVQPLQGEGWKDGFLQKRFLNCSKASLTPGQEVMVRVLEADVENDVLKLAKLHKQPRVVTEEEQQRYLEQLDESRSFQSQNLIGSEEPERKEFSLLQEVDGTVVHVYQYGCYVDIGDSKPARVIAKRLGVGNVADVRDAVKIGDKCRVRIVGSGMNRELAAAMDAKAESFANLAPEQRLRGVIHEIEQACANIFVWTPDGQQSRFLKLEMALVPQEMRKTWEQGQEVMVRVAAVNVPKDEVVVAVSEPDDIIGRSDSIRSMVRRLTGRFRAQALERLRSLSTRLESERTSIDRLVDSILVRDYVEFVNFLNSLSTEQKEFSAKRSELGSSQKGRRRSRRRR